MKFRLKYVWDPDWAKFFYQGRGGPGNRYSVKALTLAGAMDWIMATAKIEGWA